MAGRKGNFPIGSQGRACQPEQLTKREGLTVVQGSRFAFTANSRILYLHSNHGRPGKRLIFNRQNIFQTLDCLLYCPDNFSWCGKYHEMSPNITSPLRHRPLHGKVHSQVKVKISRINCVTDHLPSPLTAPHRTHPASVPASRPSTSPTSCPRCPCVPVWTR